VRFVHTSDWHLGRRLCEASLIGEQAHALEQVLAVCADARAEALIVAGDVYDRAVPPIEAVELLSQFLARAADRKLPVVLAAGNHDGPERLAFGREILAGRGVHVFGTLAHRTTKVVVGDTAIYVLPYCEPEAARAELGDATLQNHDAAVRAALAALVARRDAARSQGERAVLVAHLFAAGGRETADSERPIAVGTAGQVGIDALDGWDYVALGHLHAPQAVGGREAVRYSGSLYKYSFGEANQEKGVTVVEVGAAAVRVESVPLPIRRDVVRLEASFDELLVAERFRVAEDAYVEATYTDTGYVVDAAARLRQRFANLLAARPRQIVAQVSGPASLERALVPDDLALLRGFWAHVQAAGPLEPEHEAAWARVLGAARAGERERDHLEVVK
jgi:exonuclease SbcD